MQVLNTPSSPRQTRFVPNPERVINLREQFCTVVGIPVLPPEVRQIIYDADDLYQTAKESAPHLRRVLNAACAAAEIPTSDSIVAKTKSPARFHEKLHAELDGKVTAITDLCRGKIEARSPEEILKLAEFFRPRNNSLTVKFMDNFSRPDESKMGLRRMKIIYRLPNEHRAEIMVYHKEFDQNCLDETHRLYEAARQIEAQYKGLIMPSEVKETYDYIQQQRKFIHDEWADRLGLNDLVEHRRFFFCDKSVTGTPHDVAFMLVERKMGDLRVAVTADPQTGYYKVENSLLTALEDEQNYKDNLIEIDRETFLMYSMDLVNRSRSLNPPPLRFIMP